MRNSIFLVGIVCIYSIVEANICKDRARWGNTCKTCSEAVYCMQQAGEWKEIPLETCDQGYICEDSNGDCVKSNATCYSPASHKEFDCKVAGIFPDPLNCKYFYVCYSTNTETAARITFQHKSRLLVSSESEYLQALRLECPIGKLYSARTQSCTLREENNICTKVNCQRPGQQAAWPDDDELFYVCTPVDSQGKRELYPTMLRCSAGEMFNGASCVRAFPSPIYTTNNQITATTKSPPIMPQPAVTNPTSTSTPEASFRCSHKGLSPHPSDCSKYYYCDANLTAKSYSCPENQKFSAEFRSCIRGQC